MLISIIIILIYLSFLIEFLFWPVSSEASTGQLLGNWKQNKAVHNLIYIIIIVFNSLFTIAPLLVSLYSLFHNDLFEVNLITIIGLTLGWTGRIISASAAFKLHKANSNSLITDSMFKWSRNPISLGLFITFFGLILVIPHFLLFIGYVFFILTTNYKIGIEEKFLRQKYGTGYHHYVRSTPKYLII